MLNNWHEIYSGQESGPVCSGKKPNCLNTGKQFNIALQSQCSTQKHYHRHQLTAIAEFSEHGSYGRFPLFSSAQTDIYFLLIEVLLCTKTNTIRLSPAGFPGYGMKTDVHIFLKNNTTVLFCFNSSDLISQIYTTFKRLHSELPSSLRLKTFSSCLNLNPHWIHAQYERVSV